jgi:cytochrome c-type biogenesis protein CcmH/NrfF
MACVVFQVLSPLRLLFVLVPVMVIVDGVCVVWLLRNRRRAGTAEATEDSEEVRPR